MLYESHFMTHKRWILSFEVRQIEQIQDPVEIEHSSNSDHILTNPEWHLIPDPDSECQNQPGCPSDTPSGEFCSITVQRFSYPF